MDGEPDLDGLAPRIRDGDRGAFDELAAAFWRPVLGYFWRRLARADAEELTQTTFVNVYRTLRRGGGRELADRESWARYLFRAARNALADHWRARPPIADAVLDDVDGEGTAWIERVADPHTADDASLGLQAGEESAALEECLDRLDARSRRLTWLHFVEERPRRELARACGRPESSLRLDMARILHNLRMCLEGKGIAV